MTISQREHERLSRMAGETGRTAAGYLRWLLHRHFGELDQEEPRE
ncbi:hypothetical protein [Oscillibacter sp.]|nr:hypothetical protein [Oscillibacter sp.]